MTRKLKNIRAYGADKLLSQVTALKEECSALTHKVAVMTRNYQRTPNPTLKEFLIVMSVRHDLEAKKKLLKTLDQDYNLR